MPVGPRDIDESDSPAEKLAVQSLMGKIDGELLRQRFQGPHIFRLFLAEHLTTGAGYVIENAYDRLWKSAKVICDPHDRKWYIEIEAYEHE